MRNPDGKAVRGICGHQPVLGFVMIQVPFLDLGITIGFDFMLLPESIPSIFSMRDIYNNGLDISHRRKVITFAGMEQKLTLYNYFLTTEWTPHDVPFSLYTENELRNMHRMFRHQYIQWTTGLLKRASGGQLDG